MYSQHLVIGATGKTGSRVVQRLKDNGFTPKEASRTSSTFFSWQDTASWSPALENIDAVYLTYFPDLALPQATKDIHHFCELASKKGVKHITLLSGRGEPAAQACEEILKNSGLSWTVVRASWFNQNFSEGLFQQFILNRHIALPVNTVGEPFVDIDDIADVVFASLTQEGHTQKLYEVTGPELLSFEQLAALFSQQLGETVTFESIPLATFRQQLNDVGVPPEVIDMLTYLFTEVLDGRNEYCEEGVTQALNRPAKPFSQFIQDNISAFANAT